MASGSSDEAEGGTFFVEKNTFYTHCFGFQTISQPLSVFFIIKHDLVNQKFLVSQQKLYKCIPF
jgi:hypothetical protein